MCEHGRVGMHVWGGVGVKYVGVITLSLSDANVLGSSSNSLTRLCKHFLRNRTVVAST